MYEAYRRMYQAMGVQNIDAILPVPVPPQPTDPGLENGQALMGEALQAFRMQNHLAHIDSHRAFFSSNLVRNNPQAMVVLQSHMMEHVALQAREEVEQEMQEEMKELQQKFGGEIPQEEQIRIQEVLESKIAERISEMTEEMITEEQSAIESQSGDPLIDLKQQEINLKHQDIQRKTMMDQAKLGLDQEKLSQTAELTQDKIESQEDIAQLRANVNLQTSKAKQRDKKIDLKETEMRNRRK